MRCRRARKGLALLVGGDLPEREVPQLMAHLKQCPECAVEFEWQQRCRDAVGQVARSDRPELMPDDFSWQIQRRIAAQGIRSATSPAGQRTWRKPVWAGIALGGALAILLLIFTSRSGEERLAVRQMSTRERAEVQWDSRLFGSVERPHRLDDWQPTGRPGIYAVMHRPDPQGRPDLYVIDYCGESHKGLMSGNPWLQYLRQQITERTGSPREIYVAVYPMPDSSRRERQRLHRLLVRHWKPFFNSLKGA